MILLDIKHYIREHQKVPAAFLRHRFNLSQDALEGLLAPLIQQGHIQMLSSAESDCTSGQCSSHCQSSSENTYLWTDKALKPLPIALEIH